MGALQIATRAAVKTLTWTFRRGAVGRTIARTVAKVATRALKYAGIPLRDPALTDLFGLRPTSSGVWVDEHSAMSVSAFFSGVAHIAATMAMLGISCVETLRNGSQQLDQEHVGTEFFRDGPSPYTTPFQFIELL